jgi:hypothetical protein
MTTNHGYGDDEWTPEENAMFASLPRERIPSAELKVRTLDALRYRVGATTIERRSSRNIFILAAAACLIFIAGAVVGFAAARRAARPASEPPVTASNRAVARSDAPILILQPEGHVVWY